MQFGLQLERFLGRGACRNGSAEPDVVCSCDDYLYLYSDKYRSLFAKTMSGQDAFRRFAQQVQRAGGSGGRVPPGGAGLVAGTIALIGGAALLNASLFNGEYTLRLFTFYES